ncbi:MAG: hypothetical protein AAB254_04345, partial [candidate division NC10 bacterium]
MFTGPQGTPIASISLTQAATDFRRVMGARISQLLHVLRPQGIRGEVGMGREIRAADGVAEALPLLRPHRQDHVAVGGLEGLEGGDGRVARPERARDLPGRHVAHDGILQDGHLAVQHAHVHQLSLARGPSVGQRCQDAD